MAILEIKNLRVDYQTDDALVHALNDVNLKMEKGKTLGLVGETGAGKQHWLNVLWEYFLKEQEGSGQEKYFMKTRIF